MASLAEELKAVRAEVEEARAQKLEEMAKLESALAQIEALKKEVEVSNEHQKVTIEALEKANRSLTGAQEAYHFLETQVKWYVDDASHAREEAQRAREETVQEYVANFHNTDEYKNFSAYWRNFAYAEVMERAEELYPNLDLTQLRSEFVDEVPQTPAEDVQGNEAAEVGKPNADAQAAETLSTEAPPPSTQA
ncbi:protein bangles and beads-like [Olea europaea var. sylvestris]|uniref:protein bangles and beads-like n=1 Tax=Olea europaea var. sylvestris TaxID=158386 RepID=UPI000C1D4A84|nr:protein bangles and beads-like [Olea europaea var. sylvestris]